MEEDVAEGFVAVDWGTSSLRAVRINAAGEVTARFRSQAGVKALERSGMAVALKEAIEAVAPEGTLPIMASGMIGSTLGWSQVPYIACPAGADAISAGAHPTRIGGHSVLLVPGLRCNWRGNPDVLRGEEVELLGLQAPMNTIIALPGTHTKWARMEDGEVVSFRTFMTGELFDLLASSSVLAPAVAESGSLGEAFDRGIEEGLDPSFSTGAAFSVRARSLVLGECEMDSASRLRGMLIGEELRAVRESGDMPDADGEVWMTGNDALCRMYERGLARLGIRVRTIAQEDAFRAGMIELWRRLRRRRRST